MGPRVIFRRRKLPPDLRDALRAPYRPSPLQRLRAWLRAGAAILLVGIVILIGWRTGLVGLLAPLPRIVHAIPEDTPAAATRFTARVEVVDGDTLAMGSDRLRIHGIDAPETGQSCERAGRIYDCGEAARSAIAGVLGRGIVSCEQLDTDRFGRRIVRCHDDRGRDIGAELVRQGWALAFRRFSTDYIAQEAEARTAGRGLWAGSFEAPWDWRARSRN